jgi:hypothetical protein
MWSGPRNISTAIMYAFAQRNDTEVYDEPLYAYYLKNSEAKEYHPGADSILANMENDGGKVIQMMQGHFAQPVVFFKHMTKHLLNLNLEFMHGMVNIILTRDPEEMLPSFAKVIKNPSMEDVGYKRHVELINYFNKNDIDYVVLDSKKVLLNPKKVLRELCKRIDIPFQIEMLSWEANPRPEDGIWAPYWYDNIHNSTGFIAYQSKKEKFPEALKPLLNDCLPYYKKLLQEAIG